jgi:LysM repeat protein
MKRPSYRAFASVIFFYLFVHVFSSSYAGPGNEIFKAVKDTGRKVWHTQPSLDMSTADSMAAYLLSENELFKEFWNNEMTFSYDDFDPAVLPEIIEIPLISGDEKFVLTWYGGLTSSYGPRWGRMHHGLDLHLRTGDTVVSAFDGIVRFAGYNKSGFGNCVVVRHLNGLETLYGHLSKISVVPNQFLKAGELLGLGGSTGRSSGPHLHFETRYKDYSFDPLLIIDRQSNGLKSDKLVISKKTLLKKRYASDKSLNKKSDDDKSDRSGSENINQVTNAADSVKFVPPVIVADDELEEKKEEKIKESKIPVEKKKDNTKKPVDQKKTTKPVEKKVVMPKKKAEPAFHIVKSGENLWVISRKYGMGTEKLLKLNNLKPNAILQPGQKLRLK